jgi:hypothetical protein
MSKKKKIEVGHIHTSIAECKDRFTGWTGGYGIHSDKSKFNRNRNKKELRKIIKEEQE